MNLIYRLATEADLIDIVRLLADDPLGAARDPFQLPLPESYYRAFRAIANDPNQELTVAEQNGEIVATFQLSFIPCLTHQGSTRAQVESVRVKSTYRGQGIGTTVFEYIIRRASEKGARLLQLTTDKKRHDAKRFYASLGFVDSHEGMKLNLHQ
ncbi:GNAT family N-acetyltransferase [Spirosoma sp. 209]|uniref:GNAT family N-acetyltransferase n=1 Tax=Spirosoma sp. 209 TaxID=1955701 RepID=UPI00098D348A|nr:GNAT family N-acetyltransferase [Spirosoma sp. 209]